MKKENKSRRAPSKKTSASIVSSELNQLLEEGRGKYFNIYGELLGIGTKLNPKVVLSQDALQSITSNVKMLIDRIDEILKNKKPISPVGYSLVTDEEMEQYKRWRDLWLDSHNKRSELESKYEKQIKELQNELQKKKTELEKANRTSNLYFKSLEDANIKLKKKGVAA